MKGRRERTDIETLRRYHKKKIFFDSTGNLLTRESPERVCAFLLPNLILVVNAFFENLMNGRDPNEVTFNRTGCFDVGPACGGWDM
ncbi:MAG: hypothetical protein J7M30_06085 [Deltaproteobacteria bacterium]|nr:hypothetical protein [Deltaproteobacteria bacterium]